MKTIRNILHDGVRRERAATNVTITHSPMGGRTTFERSRVVGVSAPLTSGAFARTVRIHELLHANNSKPPRRHRWPELAVQAVEDARVHLIYWPSDMPSRVNRDCLAVGLNELRRLPPIAAMRSADDWNKALLVALRCMAIVSKLGNQELERKACERVASIFGPSIVRELSLVLHLITLKTGHSRAIKAFVALMRSDEAVIDSDGKGVESTNPMRIITLPMDQPCDAAPPQLSLARSGGRLNRARLAHALTVGSTAGLFIRRQLRTGGTILIDASGSMCWSADTLNEMCRRSPLATVAYYSGFADEGPVFGELVIYAENGRRASEVSSLHGGNDVDLFAIRWLLRQPAPRIYVGDGDFCGGPAGQAVEAAKLMASAVASGLIDWRKNVRASA